jgi:DNA-binding HxlR family transcriptional regulator
VLVLRDVVNGVHRFDDIQGHLGVARDVLTKRLAALVEHGVIERAEYQEPGSRRRHEYRATAAGRALRPVLLAMIAWGDAHRGDGHGAPLVVRHEGCGAAVHVAVECEAGHRIDPAERLGIEAGPGARRTA